MIFTVKTMVLGGALLCALTGGLWFISGSDERQVERAFSAEEQTAAADFNQVLHAGYEGGDGHTLRTRRAFDAEMTHLQEQLDKDPNDPVVVARRIHLGVSFDPEQAIAECREVLRRHPQNTFALNHLAAAYFQQGKTEQALEYAARSLAQERHPNTCHLIARLFLHQGRPEKAREYFEAALAADPEHAASRGALERLMLQGH